jgi:hypothetical protein
MREGTTEYTEYAEPDVRRGLPCQCPDPGSKGRFLIFRVFRVFRSLTRSLLIAVIVVGCNAFGGDAPPVTNVPKEIRGSFKLSTNYAKLVSVGGFPVLGSRHVHDAALREAAWLIRQMLGDRDDILHALASNRVRFVVMAGDEMTTAVPEHSDLQPAGYWDRRARGLGATRPRPAVSCGEENLLKLKGDPYAAENILVHEFAHAVHEMAMRSLDRTFDDRLRAAYQTARKEGLWRGAYASSNPSEYWAEGVQSWFDTNRENDKEHNHVNTRLELVEYDPRLAALIKEVFGDRDFRYTPPANRRSLAHLKDFDPNRASEFKWPERVLNWNDEVLGKRPAKDPEWQALKPIPVAAGRAQQSDPGRKPVGLLIANARDHEIRYHWVDTDGKLHDYGRVPPGAIANLSTIAGHLWLITDGDDKAVVYFRVGHRLGRALVR